MPVRARVVVFGGTGHFGSRISRRLARKPGLDIVVTSRSLASAQTLATEIRRDQPAARVTAAQLDQDGPDLQRQLAELEATLVIHTAGPYQAQDYRVAEACIACGCHYVDLADGRGFVAGFERLDERARQAGITLVTGASTLPGVSGAVVDEYRDRFDQIREVAISIAPAHRTPRGMGTIEAVLSYCGTPFLTWAGGAWRTVHGWQDLRMQRYRALGRRLSGACDVPDLALFPDYIPGVQTVSFHAALEAPWEQLGLWSMAWLSRWGIVRDWTGFAGTFSRLSQRLMRFGSERGGMHVRLAGTDRLGQAQRIDWHLIAEDNHGPEIPCTPAIVTALRIIERGLVAPGAHPCLGLFGVKDLMNELRDFQVRIEQRAD